MPDPSMPATLGEAIATEPTWLQGWLFVLGGVQLLAILFLVTRGQGRWRVRPEPVAILLSLPLAAVSMEWLYAQVGFVRLLGLPHLVYWTPVYGWILARRHSIDTTSLFGEYVVLYLIVVGTSLVIDVVDVVRYLLGDGELLHRWG